MNEAARSAVANRSGDRMSSFCKVSWILLISTALAATNTVAQSDQQGSPVNITPRPANRERNLAAAPRANIRVDTTLVPIPVAVTDPLSRFVTGLDKQDFRLYEDKVEQEIVQLSSEDVPLSVGLVFDTSGSMGEKLSWSRQAVAQFMKTANPEDEFFLVEFNDRPNIAVGFTSDAGQIQDRLTNTQAKGRTALLDSVYMAISHMKKAHNPRKAVLIISDGGDNSSRYTETELKNVTRESDVQLYVVGIYERPDLRERTTEEAHGPDLLRTLAERSGGRSFEVGNLADLPDVAAKIGLELRNEYVLYYSPKNLARDGRYRRVQVKLVKKPGLPPLNAAFRTGYFAPKL
jgi:Ca-activated chloride channel family protein